MSWVDYTDDVADIGANLDLMHLLAVEADDYEDDIDTSSDEEDIEQDDDDNTIHKASGKTSSSAGVTNKKWPWPWTKEDEQQWGIMIKAQYGEITDLDRKIHRNLLTNRPDKTVSNEQYALGMRRRLLLEPISIGSASLTKEASGALEVLTNHSQNKNKPNSTKIKGKKGKGKKGKGGRRKRR